MCRVSKNKKGHVEKWEKDRQAQWQPSASIAMLQRRAELLAAIRHYFHNEAVMEVETPVLSHAGNPDCYIDSFVTQTIIDGRAQTLYMQTSPEFCYLSVRYNH